MEDRTLLLEDIRRRLLAAEHRGDYREAANLRKQLSELANQATVNTGTKR